jgi:hypothetical protein
LGYLHRDAMSLLRIINNPAARRVLDAHITKPDVECRKVMVVPPRAGANASRVGTALDYALRFGLLARHGGSHRPTIAEQAAELIVRRRFPLPTADAAERQRLADRCATARHALDRIGTGRELTQPVAEAALILAGYDPVYRAGEPGGLNREPDVAEIEDLVRLYGVVPWDDFAPRQRLVPNPTFNEGSALVGGGDGDLLIDDMLIEIKTTKELTLERETIRQVVCYAVLANRFGVYGWPATRTVHRVGVYVARARKLYVFPLRDCVHTASEAAVLGVLIGTR